MANFSGEIVTTAFPVTEGTRSARDGLDRTAALQVLRGTRAGWNGTVRLQKPAHFLLTAFCTGDSQQKFWTDVAVTTENAPPHTGSLTNFHVLGQY